MLTQIVLACLISLASAQYGPQYKAPSYANSYETSYEPKPEPYSFGYDVKDDYGATQNRKEEGDAYGNVKGSYGYSDGYGLYRHVDYVADNKGFRAYVKTNEPGTDNKNPADVQVQSYAAPIKYDGPSAYGKAPAYSAPVASAYNQPAPSYDRPAPSYKPAPTTYSSAPVYQQEAYPSSGYKTEAPKPYKPTHFSYPAPEPAKYQPAYEPPKYQPAPESAKYHPTPVNKYSSY